MLKDTKVFIIDDFASVGQEKQARIDLLLRTANPLKEAEAFGGKTIILFGSPFTAPRPVLDTSLFETYNYIDPENKFKNPQPPYLEFRSIYFMTHSFRHISDNKEQSEKYLKFLNRLKSNECTKEDADFVR